MEKLLLQLFICIIENYNKHHALSRWNYVFILNLSLFRQVMNMINVWIKHCNTYKPDRLDKQHEKLVKSSEP